MVSLNDSRLSMSLLLNPSMAHVLPTSNTECAPIVARRNGKLRSESLDSSMLNLPNVGNGNGVSPQKANCKMRPVQFSTVSLRSPVESNLLRRRSSTSPKSDAPSSASSGGSPRSSLDFTCVVMDESSPVPSPLFRPAASAPTSFIQDLEF
eukprot:GILJ01002623.1.p1 GENE.GILJ01002623.1~~GILJ01002623.1.p1  ORF type:complete len:151 (+),score=16.80 GILJ01002623.1:66-518(+)